MYIPSRPTPKEDTVVVRINWATNTNRLTKLLDTRKVTRLILLRQENVNAALISAGANRLDSPVVKGVGLERGRHGARPPLSTVESYLWHALNGYWALVGTGLVLGQVGQVSVCCNWEK